MHRKHRIVWSGYSAQYTAVVLQCNTTCANCAMLKCTCDSKELFVVNIHIPIVVKRFNQFLYLLASGPMRTLADTCGRQRTTNKGIARRDFRIAPERQKHNSSIHTHTHTLVFLLFFLFLFSFHFFSIFAFFLPFS